MALLGETDNLNEIPRENPIAPAYRSKDGTTLVTKCPYCTRKHLHGVEFGVPVGGGDGFRGPHCGNPVEYYVREYISYNKNAWTFR